MKIDPLPPIPSPPEHYWRQFRVNALPFVAFGLALLATIWLWGRNLSNPLVMGQAESPEADITSPKAGRISQMPVQLYQEVKAGDVVAVVNTTDPLVLSNTIAVIRARMDNIRANAGFQPGDKLRYAQLQLDWMQLRAELATLKAQQQYAQAEFDRLDQLASDKVVNQTEIDIAKRDLEQANQNVESKTVAAETTGAALKQLDPASVSTDSTFVRSEIMILEQQLHLAEAELQPIKLTAPISGRISKLDKLVGMTVATREAILTIANPAVDRIVGYLGQPLRIEPKLGMKANIRTRGLGRVSGEATITHIGPRIELFGAPLRVRGMGAAQERGLPIVFTVPQNMKLRPGELVDISLVTDR